MEPSAVGFRVKSGRAIAVLLAGATESPVVVDRRDVRLADPEDPDAIQPYHVALDLPGRPGRDAVARLVRGVERYARRCLGELFEHYREGGHRVLGVGIVVGSDVDPATIANDHIRAHAEEGRLFRRVIESAARNRRLPFEVTVEKRLLAEASRGLGRPEPRLKECAAALGRGTSGPWRADEKAAALSAWMALASRRRDP